MSKFTFTKTPLEGVIVVEPTCFCDNRGFFMEVYQREEFVAGGIGVDFVQDNHSKSVKGVLRGMHFQKQRPQGKLVRVLFGTVFDVALDLRPKSATFGQWYAIELSGENKKQLYVPKGFGHGFLVTSDAAEFTYKCTDYYAKEQEGGILYNDPTINIKWPDIGVDYILSQKDLINPPLNSQTFEFYEGL